MTMRLRQVIRRAALLLGVLAIGIAPMSALAPAASAGLAHSAAKHAKKKHKNKGKKKKGGCHIPQGNVKDNDSDNHGGPSDGDGCM